MKGLYIHIPFCHAICTYCDFAKEIASPQKQTRYIDQLITEVNYYQGKYDQLETIYIGGGTPSALEYKDLEKLLVALSKVIDLSSLKEFSIETNPQDINDQFIDLIQAYHVNRVSIGVQTFNETALKFLNRKHSPSTVYTAIDRLRKKGLTNINLDMMFALVNQTRKDLEDDIFHVKTLNVPHISYYSLILEEDTRLYHLVETNQVKMLDNAIEAAMYETVITALKSFGYHHYEISNFAKNNQFSKHNLLYWTNEDYLGVGASSHSKIGSKRFFNVRSVKKYIEAVDKNQHGVEDYYPYEGINDVLLMGLRLMGGVNIKTIEKTYDLNFFETYPEVQKYIDLNYLSYDNDVLKFTHKGLMLGNEIFSLFAR